MTGWRVPVALAFFLGLWVGVGGCGASGLKTQATAIEWASFSVGTAKATIEKPEIAAVLGSSGTIQAVAILDQIDSAIEAYRTALAAYAADVIGAPDLLQIGAKILDLYTDLRALLAAFGVEVSGIPGAP